MTRILVSLCVFAIAATNVFAESGDLLDKIAGDSPEVLKDKAKSGNPSAQYDLAKLYLGGMGVEQDTAQGISLLEKAAQQGYGQAMFTLGSIYHFGLAGLDINTEKAKAWYEAATKQGVAEAAYRRMKIGQEYEKLTWLRKAAELGSADAQYELGWEFALGRAVIKDEAEAVRWYKLAAQQNHPSALYTLGMAYRFGQGVPQDYKAAFLLFSSAAEKGHLDARYEFGRSYAAGEGVARDDFAALAIFRSLAKDLHREAVAQIAAFYMTGRAVEKNPIVAYAIYNFSATKAGNTEETRAQREKAKSLLNAKELEVAQQLTWRMLESDNFLAVLDRFSTHPSQKGKTKNRIAM